MTFTAAQQFLAFVFRSRVYASKVPVLLVKLLESLQVRTVLGIRRQSVKIVAESIIKLFSCSNKRSAMNTYGRMEVLLRTLLTSAIH
jgi:hypothetical protein